MPSQALWGKLQVWCGVRHENLTPTLHDIRSVTADAELETGWLAYVGLARCVCVVQRRWTGSLRMYKRSLAPDLYMLQVLSLLGSGARTLAVSIPWIGRIVAILSIL